jgi:uncharacterized protein DUF262/uncharacterized protein DUF1524
VTQLFELAVRYLVPLYQRPYVWKEEDQWEPLWGDVVTLLEHQIEGDGQQYSHFMGAIVLDQITQAPGKIPIYTVIDGQQRLTTLQIVLAAASNVAAEFGGERDAEIMRDLVRNDPKRATGEETFKVWPTNANRLAFQAVMADGGPPEGHEDDPNNRIDEAYAFFHDRVKEWASEADEELRQDRLELLRITICELLKVVSITLEADDNAQVIFETLNARGTPLLALDLVKNAVFLEADRRGLQTDSLYEQVWKPEFDVPERDEYWRQERRQGRLFRPVAELFLMHWLTMKLRRLIPATELFSIFRGQVLSATPPPEIGDLIPEICRDAGTMRSFDDLESGSVEAMFFDRLQILDITTVLPLMLFLFREPAISPERRRRSLQVVESWLVRRMIMGLSTKNYSQQIPVMIGRVAAAADRADEVILEELRTGIGKASVWPTDDELRAQLLTRGMYGYIGQARIAMVLSAVETSLYTSKVEALQIPKGLSIEHVLPQDWEEHWPLPSGLSADELLAAEEARTARIHRLGNLTITSLPLNSAMQNAAWLVKQKQLNKGSKLLINQWLIDEFPDRFEESSIDRRGEWLADRIISSWPGPDAWGDVPAPDGVETT